MDEIEKKKECYVIVNGVKVLVSEEIRAAYMRPFWREMKQRERARRCLDVTGKRVCREDCSLCLRDKAGVEVSLESLLADGRFDAAAADTVEETIERNELLAALHREVGRLPDTERRLIMMEAAGVGYRKICAELGLSEAAYYRRRKRILGMLRVRLEKYR